MLQDLKELDRVIIPGRDNYLDISNYLTVAVWTEDAPQLEEYGLPFRGLTRLVWEQLRRDDFWDVNEDDMSAMGAMYAYEMTVRELEEMM